MNVSPRPAVVRQTAATFCETDTTHNARQQRAPNSQCLFASVPKVRESGIVKSGDFSVEFDDNGGLKNRRLAECKMSIGQVLISRTLSVCGEVAEWPKAAVC